MHRRYTVWYGGHVLMQRADSCRSALEAAFPTGPQLAWCWLSRTRLVSMRLLDQTRFIATVIPDFVIPESQNQADARHGARFALVLRDHPTILAPWLPRSISTAGVVQWEWVFSGDVG